MWLCYGVCNYPYLHLADEEMEIQGVKKPGGGTQAEMKESRSPGSPSRVSITGQHLSQKKREKAKGCHLGGLVLHCTFVA